MLTGGVIKIIPYSAPSDTQTLRTIKNLSSLETSYSDALLMGMKLLVNFVMSLKVKMINLSLINQQ